MLFLLSAGTGCHLRARHGADTIGSDSTGRGYGTDDPKHRRERRNAVPYNRSERPRVALATATQARGLDDDEPVLVAALREHGVEAAPVVWNDPAAEWTAWDAVVLRSAWDYPSHHDAFVAWTRHVEAVRPLHNSAEVVAWNADKRYLPALAERGVRTVPTEVLEPNDAIDLPDDVHDIVVKPVVSAGSQDTARYGSHERPQAREHIERLWRQHRGVLVQPYLSQVDEYGETAMVFVADSYSHAIRKGPILRDEPETVGGLFAREDLATRTATDAERAVAEQTLDALPFDRRTLLYARVDLVPSADGTPLVLEVELIEPSLFLRYCHGAADRFAAAIVDALPAEPTSGGAGLPDVSDRAARGNGGHTPTRTRT